MPFTKRIDKQKVTHAFYAFYAFYALYAFCSVTWHKQLRWFYYFSIRMVWTFTFKLQIASTLIIIATFNQTKPNQKINHMPLIKEYRMQLFATISRIKKLDWHWKKFIVLEKKIIKFTSQQISGKKLCDLIKLP